MLAFIMFQQLFYFFAYILKFLINLSKFQQYLKKQQGFLTAERGMFLGPNRPHEKMMCIVCKCLTQNFKIQNLDHFSLFPPWSKPLYLFIIKFIVVMLVNNII